MIYQAPGVEMTESQRSFIVVRSAVGVAVSPGKSNMSSPAMSRLRSGSVFLGPMHAYYSTVGDFSTLRYLVFADEFYGVGARDVSNALR